MGTRRHISFCVAILAGLMLTLGCGRKATDQPESHPQGAAASSAPTSSGPWRMELKVSPDHPSMTKPITLQLHIVDERGQPVSDAQVNGSLTMKLMDMGTTALKFSPKGNGDYEADVKSVDMSGPWGLAVDAAQGSVHAKQSFEILVFE